MYFQHLLRVAISPSELHNSSPSSLRCPWGGGGASGWDSGGCRCETPPPTDLHLWVGKGAGIHGPGACVNPSAFSLRTGHICTALSPGLVWSLTSDLSDL